MNKITNIILSSAVILFSACSLNLDDPKNLSSSSFWKSEKDARSNLNSCYSATIDGIKIYDDAYVDIVRCPYPWESNGAKFKQNNLSAGDDEGYNFEGVRMCNVFLANINNVPMNEQLKKRMIAEARVLRAMNYMDLTLNFGKVPIIKEPVNYDIKTFKRDEVKDVRKFILDELEDSYNYLPDKYSGGFLNEKTRITKYAALSLKARAALYFGDYRTAEDAAKKVIDSGIYALHKINSLPDGTEKEIAEIEKLVDFSGQGINKERFLKGIFSYRSIWDKENVNADNPECIIVKEYIPGNSSYVDLVRYTSMRPDQMIAGWSSVVPTQNLVNMYWNANGEKNSNPTVSKRAESYKTLETAYSNEMKESSKSFTDIANEWINSGKFLDFEYFNEFKNRDTRLYASIMFPFKRISDTDAGENFVYRWKKGGKNESTTGFNFIKMVAKNSNTLLWGQYPCSESNFPSMRYAEVLLIFAEAHIYNTGYDGEVQKVLNQIRDRAGMPDVPSSMTKGDAINFIRNERCIELAGEGNRYYDIKRYDSEYVRRHMDGVPITTPDGETVLTMQWNERMRLKPLPQSAIDLNSELQKDQNSGY